MDRKTKENLIREYAKDLKELAKQYEIVASKIESMPDGMVDMMMVIRAASNEIHQQVANGSPY